MQALLLIFLFTTMHGGYPAGMHWVSWLKINKIKTNALTSILCIMHFGHEHYGNQACHLGLPHMGAYSGNACSLGHYPTLQITSNKSPLEIHFTFWNLKDKCFVILTPVFSH
jgi:hypothetical protein